MASLLSEQSGDGRPDSRLSDGHGFTGLGELLKRARQRRGLTLEQISDQTKIPLRHLQALENESLAVIPSGFYRRAEIRSYARAVSLDPKVALAALDRALARAEPEPVFQRPRATPTISRTRLLIATGVMVAAAVLGRAIGGREPAVNENAPLGQPVESSHRAVPAIPETPPEGAVGTVQSGPPEPVPPPQATPPAPSWDPVAAAKPALAPPAAVSSTQLVATTQLDVTTQLVVTTEPVGARVTVNGIGWGTAPITISNLPPGEKRIRVTKEGYTAEERVVRVVDGRASSVDIRLQSVP